MRYPVDILSSDGGVCVRLRDLPSIEGVGPTQEEAIERCLSALVAHFAERYDAGQPIPEPLEDCSDGLCLPASILAKIILMNAVISEGITNTELARRMNLSRQEMNRILNLNHSTKIDTIQKALQVLGRHLKIYAY